MMLSLAGSLYICRKDNRNMIMKKKNLRDIYHIMNDNGEREVTLQKICNIIGIDVPERFIDTKDDIINNVTIKYSSITEGCAYFRIFKLEDGPTALADIVPKISRKGASFIFVDKNHYYESGLDKNEYPCIPVPDIINRCGRFFSYIKELNDVRTIAVTGTCGKTTTMNFLKSIVPRHYRTFTNKGNANSFMSVADHIMSDLAGDEEIYIQETGAGSVNAVKKAAAMLDVDAFILLNVFSHHVSEYGSEDNILRDKASFDRNMKDDGVCVVNYDDERIASYPFRHNVISFGIKTGKDVNYRAANVRQEGEYLEMDVIYDETKVHLSVNILGEHNAYNVLAAFALSKWLGISDDEIAGCFEKYRSSGVRQNYREVSGYKLLIDCYNICEDSLAADIETARKISVVPGCKKIAVITGENNLGNCSETLSFNMGRNLDFSCFSNVICVGIKDETEKNLDYYGNGRAVYEGIKSTGFEDVLYVNSTADLEHELRNIISEGDLILFKGIYRLDLTLVIDSIFSTGIAMNNVYYTNNGEKYSDGKFTGLKVKYLEGLDLLEYKGRTPRHLKIPDYIDGHPVYRTGKNLFYKNRRIWSVDFGSTMVNIGRDSFRGCRYLRKVRIPGNVKVIDERAFMGCSFLREVVIEDGVTQICRDAFKNCRRLRKVQIPDSVRNIDKTAFENCLFTIDLLDDKGDA